MPSTNRSGPYRSRSGLFLGVCKGLAEHLNLSVFWTRVLVVIIALTTAFWPVFIVYVLAALLMKPAPAKPIQDEYEREFYDSYTASRVRGIHRLKRKFDSLDRRIRRMEDKVTSREYDWKRRFNE
jgi:phage shock protein C